MASGSCTGSMASPSAKTSSGGKPARLNVSCGSGMLASSPKTAGASAVKVVPPSGSAMAAAGAPQLTDTLTPVTFSTCSDAASNTCTPVVAGPTGKAVVP